MSNNIDELKRLLAEEKETNRILRDRLDLLYRHIYTAEFHHETFHCDSPITPVWNGPEPVSLQEVVDQLDAARLRVAQLTDLKKRMMKVLSMF